MRNFGLIALIVLSGHLAAAKKAPAAEAPKKAEFQQILSFYQWADLSEKKRIAYIEGLQALHANLEHSRNMRGISVGQLAPAGSSWVHRLLEAAGPLPAHAADAAECKDQQFAYHKNRDGRLCAYYDSMWNIGQYTYCSHNALQDVRNYAQLCPEKFERFVTETSAKLNPAERLAFSASVYGVRGRATPLTEPRQKDDDASADPPAQPPADTDTDKDKPEPPVAEEPRCASTQVTCEMMGESKKTLDDYRQAYRAAMDERRKKGQKAYCAVGGFISELNSRKKCSPVTNYQIGTWKGSCPGGETMCNPMIFGFQDDGKPFCAPLAQMVTSECWSRAIKAGNNAKKIQEQLLGKTPATEKIGLDSMADAWRDFRVRMNSLCEKGPSLEFHCNECNAMSMQIASMNLGSTCADRCGIVDSNISENACRASYKNRAGGGTGAVTDGPADTGDR